MARVALVPDISRIRIAAQDFAHVTEAGKLRPRQMNAARKSVGDVQRVVDASLTEISGLGALGDAKAAQRLLKRADGQAAALEQALQGVRPQRRFKWLGPRRYDASVATAQYRDLAKTLGKLEAAVERSSRVEVMSLRHASRRSPAGEAVQELNVDPKWSKPNRGKVLQTLIRGINSLGIQKAMRVRVHGAENIPKDGPVMIVASGHGSFRDGYIFGVGHNRVIRPIVAAEFFKVPGIKQFLTAAGAFPVARATGTGGDALAVQRQLMRQGEAGVAFGEGRFVSADHIGEPKSGWAWTAVQEDVPVVMASAYGGKPWYTRLGGRLAPVDVVYSKPMRFGHLAETPRNVAIAREVGWQEAIRANEQAKAYSLGRMRSHGSPEGA